MGQRLAGDNQTAADLVDNCLLVHRFSVLNICFARAAEATNSASASKVIIARTQVNAKIGQKR
jgi:hypothetical protein